MAALLLDRNTPALTGSVLHLPAPLSSLLLPCRVARACHRRFLLRIQRHLCGLIVRTWASVRQCCRVPQVLLCAQSTVSMCFCTLSGRALQRLPQPHSQMLLEQASSGNRLIYRGRFPDGG